MQVICERCAGAGVGKDVIAVAVRLPGKGRGQRKAEKREYRAFYGVLRETARWLESLGVTHVAMEATGSYPAPACHALTESSFEQVLVCKRRAGDDRGAHRRGAPRPGAGGPGAGP